MARPAEASSARGGADPRAHFRGMGLPSTQALAWPCRTRGNSVAKRRGVPSVSQRNPHPSRVRGAWDGMAKAIPAAQRLHREFGDFPSPLEVAS